LISIFARTGFEETMPNTHGAQEFGTKRKIAANAVAAGHKRPGARFVSESVYWSCIERWENEGGAGESASDRKPQGGLAVTAVNQSITRSRENERQDAYSILK
jgi:hypothetical protein